MSIQQAKRYTFTNKRTGESVTFQALITKDATRLATVADCERAASGVTLHGLISTIQGRQWDNVDRLLPQFGLSLFMSEQCPASPGGGGQCERERFHSGPCRADGEEWDGEPSNESSPTNYIGHEYLCGKCGETFNESGEPTVEHFGNEGRECGGIGILVGSW